jgi:hypothetical protein
MLWDRPQWGYSKLGVGEYIFGWVDGPVFLLDHVGECFSQEFVVIVSGAVRA